MVPRGRTNQGCRETTGEPSAHTFETVFTVGLPHGDFVTSVGKTWGNRNFFWNGSAKKSTVAAEAKKNASWREQGRISMGNSPRCKTLGDLNFCWLSVTIVMHVVTVLSI
jgi:hypothetical protein